MFLFIMSTLLVSQIFATNHHGSSNMTFGCLLREEERKRRGRACPLWPFNVQSHFHLERVQHKMVVNLDTGS